MGKILKKEEVDTYINAYQKNLEEYSKRGFVGSIEFFTEYLPKFINEIAVDGFNAGYETCKQERINNVIKNN